MSKLPGSRTVTGLFCVAALAAAGLAHADDRHFEATLSGDQEVVFDDTDMFVPGGTGSDALGRIQVKFNRAFSNVRVNLRISGLTNTLIAAHFHCGRPGENGPIVFGLVAPGDLMFDGKRIRGTLTNTDFNNEDCLPVIGRPVNNIVALAFAMRDGLIYANVHTDVFPGGEIRGQMLPVGDNGN